MANCRNCHVKPINRPRGLCWSCYYRPGVRERFKSTSKFANRGVGLVTPTKNPMPAHATCAQPGSEAKIRILEQRAARGEMLFHPNDYVPPRKVV